MLLWQRTHLGTEQAASMAIRVAPSICVAESALVAVLARRDVSASAIPASVAAAVAGCHAQSNSEEADRLAAWLLAAPWELAKAKTPHSAIKAVAEIFSSSVGSVEDIAPADVIARLPVQSVGRILLGRQFAPPVEACLESVRAAAMRACPTPRNDAGESAAALEKAKVSAKLHRASSRRSFTGSQRAESELLVRVLLPPNGLKGHWLRRRAEGAVDAALDVARAAIEAEAARLRGPPLAARARPSSLACAEWRRAAREAEDAALLEEEAACDAWEEGADVDGLGPYKHRRRAPRARHDKRPGVDGRSLRRRVRFAACERRRCRMDKECAATWAK